MPARRWNASNNVLLLLGIAAAFTMRPNQTFASDAAAKRRAALA